MSNSFEIGGFTEAVLIVRSASPHLACWVDTGGWELRHHDAVDLRLLRGWGITKASGEEWLLGRPGCSTGLVRLIRLDNAGVQSDMRPDDQCWDSGGIFDLDLRVSNIVLQSSALRAQQWHGASPPVRWDFGGLTVKEWLVRGPDNVRLALIERIDPPIVGLGHFSGLGPVFNSSQIVRDLGASLAFYGDILGFKKAVSYQTDAFAPGANVFGIPPGVASRVGLSLHILHPQGKIDGSVEIVTVPGTNGLDLSQSCAPPNFGMAALRFPVKDLFALGEHLMRCGCVLAMPITTTELAPHGEVGLLAVRSPDGAWLEFYEPMV